MDVGDIEKFGLLRYVSPKKIDLGNYDNPKLGIILPSGLIFINNSAPLEEQVMTIFHEITHMHPKFMSYTGGIWQKVIERDEKYEEEIEFFAKEVYTKRKDIVTYIISQLKEAKLHQPVSN